MKKNPAYAVTNGSLQIFEQTNLYIRDTSFLKYWYTRLKNIEYGNTTQALGEISNTLKELSKTPEGGLIIGGAIGFVIIILFCCKCYYCCRNSSSTDETPRDSTNRSSENTDPDYMNKPRDNGFKNYSSNIQYKMCDDLVSVSANAQIKGRGNGHESYTHNNGQNVKSRKLPGFISKDIINQNQHVINGGKTKSVAETHFSDTSRPKKSNVQSDYTDTEITES